MTAAAINAPRTTARARSRSRRREARWRRRLVDRLGVNEKPVARLADRLDDFRGRRTVFEDPPEFGDRARQHVLADVGPFPDLRKETFLRDDLAGTLRQAAEHMHDLRLELESL